MQGISDTTPDAAEVQFSILRAMSPADRLSLALRLTSDVIRASKRAIQGAHPEWTQREVGHAFIELHYGKELADAVREFEREKSSGSGK